MALEIRKNTLRRKAGTVSLSAKQSIDTRLNLPDYCGDIRRILRCSVETGISSAFIKGDKIGATGGIILRLIYVNDEDKIDCFETQLDLDVSTESKNLPDNALLLASAKTDYVNCRAMSQRSVSVSGSVTVNFSLLSDSEAEFISGCDSMGVQVKKTSFKARNYVCQGVKNFDLSETVSLESNYPDIGKVIFTDAYCTVDSKKTVTGKMLIKGEMVCTVVYCSEKGDNKLCNITHKMPISQIIDLAGLQEKTESNLKLKISRLIVNPKADSSGQKRLFEIAAKLTAFAECSEIKEFEGVLDCYSTDYEAEHKCESFELCVPMLEIKENKTLSKAYELQKGIKEICHIRAEETETKLQFEKDKAKVIFNSLLTIIYLNEKGVPSYAEKSFDCELQYKVAEGEMFGGEAEGKVKNITWNITDKNTVSVSAEIIFEGEICRKTKIKLCTDISLNENAAKKESDCALVLYYPQKGEDLWSIAKKYNTTIKMLEEENELKNGDAVEGKMLIIAR